ILLQFCIVTLPHSILSTGIISTQGIFFTRDLSFFRESILCAIYVVAIELAMFKTNLLLITVSLVSKSKDPITEYTNSPFVIMCFYTVFKIGILKVASKSKEGIAELFTIV